MMEGRRTKTLEVETASLGVLDKVFADLDSTGEPPSVHLELRVAGRIEDSQLKLAALSAAAMHPLARGRLAGLAGNRRWEIE